MTNFTMQGAEYNYQEERVKLTEEISSAMPNVNFKWVNKEQVRLEQERSGELNASDTIQIPVYLNKQRTNMITSVNVYTYGMPSYVWYQRGVALFAWNLE